MTTQQPACNQQEAGQETAAQHQSAPGLIHCSAGAQRQAGIHTAAVTPPDQNAQYQQDQERHHRSGRDRGNEETEQHENTKPFTPCSQQEQR